MVCSSSKKIPLNIQTALFFLFITAAQGFQQELWLYEDTATNVSSLHFQAHVKNATAHISKLKKVKRYCARGKWSVFSKPNFRKYFTSLGLAFSDERICAEADVRTAKSFRFWGANNTDVAAISLYSAENYEGDEILVTEKAHAGIRWDIKSVGGTGKSYWRLFEGKFLDKRSICYKVPATKGYFFNFDNVKDLKGLNHIRSVFKGCDLKEVEMYRKHHILVEQQR